MGVAYLKEEGPSSRTGGAGSGGFRIIKEQGDNNKNKRVGYFKIELEENKKIAGYTSKWLFITTKYTNISCKP